MILNTTRNIKLTLSSSCFYCLESDSNMCEISISKIIEKIVLFYCSSSGTINNLLNSGLSNNELLYSIFSDNSFYFQKSVSKLLIAKEGNLKKPRKLYTQNVQYNWTITKPAFFALEDDKLTDSEGHAFISEILEEYSNLNFGLREQILFQEKISQINKAINLNHPIHFVSKENKEHMFFPYKIITEPNLGYNYVAGILDNKSVCSLRIYSIKEIRIITSEHFTIDNKEFENTISTREIAYLTGKNETIIVKMNDTGEKMYHLLIHNRPRYIKKTDIQENGYRIYTFNCSEFQAFVYFCRFANNAIIISPKSLSNKLKKHYSDALEAYQAEDNN